MRAKCMTSLRAAMLILVIGATAAQAQVAPQMKMTTEIPPGIAAPDKTDTRLGTLNFFDGVPDKATVSSGRWQDLSAAGIAQCPSKGFLVSDCV